jgi:gliding motility-associated-like protein
MYRLILFQLLCLLFLSSKSQEDIVYSVNEGQWAEDAYFVSNTSSSTIILLSSEIVFGLVDGAAMHDAFSSVNEDEFDSVASASWSMVFEGANLVEPVGEDTVSTIYHYYLGNDRTKWRSNVRGVSRVRYSNLYEHIDLLVYSKKGNFKYDFVVHPGGDPSDIHWTCRGVEPRINEDSELEFELPWTTLVELSPFSYQLQGSRLEEVSSEIMKSDSSFGFVCADYDRERKLILDPEIVFATYGESGVWCNNVVPHGGGDLVTNSAAIWTDAIGTGLDSVVYGFSGFAIRLSQFTNDGSGLEWAAMVGGDATMGPYTTASNSTGVVVSGFILGDSFPISEDAFQEIQLDGPGMNDLMFALSADGSNFLGGTHLNWWGDAFGWTITQALESENEYNYDLIGGLVRLLISDSTVYFAATCRGIPQFDGISTQLFGFPDDTVGVDVVVGSMPLSMNTVNWFTVLGADSDTSYAWGHEGVNDLKFLPNGELGICGWSRQMHFPVSEGAADEAFEGEQEAWIAKLDQSNGDLLACTYFGNESREEAWVLHPMDDKIAVIGRTDYTSPYDESIVLSGESSVWIGVFDNGLTELESLYTLGSGDSHEEVMPISLGSDACGNLIFSLEKSHWQDPSGTSLHGWPISSDAFQSDIGRYYMGKLNVRTHELDFGTYYGGTTTHNNQNQILSGGIMHHGACVEHTHEAGYINPTAGVYNESDVTFSCCESSISLLDFSTTQQGEVESTVDYEVIGQCAPYEIELSQLWPDGSVTWDFGDNTSGEGHETSHVYDEAGAYTIEVSLVDSTTCNVYDTEIITIELANSPSDLSGEMVTSSGGVCELPQVLEGLFVGEGADSYAWQLNGENLGESEEAISLEITTDGLYVLMLEVEDEFCSYSRQYFDTIEVFLPLEMDWQLDFFQESLCSELEFTGLSQVSNSTWVHWSDNVGGASDEESFFAIYPQGAYEITLSAFSEPCNATSQLTQSIVVGVDNELMPVLQFPNVFTPGNDEVNDRFRLMNEVESLGELDHFSITILNRWGTILWTSDEVGFGWDGTVQGEAVSEGTYFYLVEYGYSCLADEKYSKQGSFTLLR